MLLFVSEVGAGVSVLLNCVWLESQKTHHFNPYRVLIWGMNLLLKELRANLEVAFHQFLLIGLSEA